jgi:hypothetical protein
MPTLFAPPEVMSGYSFAVDGSDWDLPKGTHLRIFAGTGGSFPLAPFVVFKIKSRQSEPRRIVVSDRTGRVVGGPDLGNLGVANVVLVTGDTDQQRTVRVDLHPDADDRLKRAVLLDQLGRTIAERVHPRWMFSAPVMHRLRLEGSAASVGISTRRVDISDVSDRQRPGELGGIFGFPIRGVFPWYFGTLTRNSGLKQVERGAPKRLNVMDQPDGPFDPVAPDDELARVNALLAEALKPWFPGWSTIARPRGSRSTNTSSYPNPGSCSLPTHRASAACSSRPWTPASPGSSALPERLTIYLISMIAVDGTASSSSGHSQSIQRASSRVANAARTC